LTKNIKFAIAKVRDCDSQAQEKTPLNLASQKIFVFLMTEISFKKPVCGRNIALKKLAIIGLVVSVFFRQIIQLGLKNNKNLALE
jgi:hypothetical protein